MGDKPSDIAIKRTELKLLKEEILNDKLDMIIDFLKIIIKKLNRNEGL